MREPFSRLLGRSERLLAAAEADLAATTGPLAMPAELLVLFSPVLSLILATRLDGLWPRLVGAALPPLLLFLLARFPLRRWRRPREWVGVTDRRVLRWRRPGALVAGPRIEEIPLGSVTAVELEQDDWDRRAGTHQLIVHDERGARSLGRVRSAERLRDAIIAAVPQAAPAGGASPPPPPDDFLPPAAPPGDYRPANGERDRAR